jgi:hypothetical protein
MKRFRGQGVLVTSGGQGQGSRMTFQACEICHNDV